MGIRDSLIGDWLNGEWLIGDWGFVNSGIGIWDLEFGIGIGIGIWDLEFGNWDLGFGIR